VNGAKAFHEWATKLGYQSTLLTDEQDAVTMSRLRDTLEKVLMPAAGSAIVPIHRCILYFAGHGLIREAEEGLWLLSDWYDDSRAVAVEVLKRRLYLYNVSQIAIFSDACRSLPPDIQTSDLTADGVLGRGPCPPSPLVAIDKYIAAQDGAVAYSIPGINPEDDRCIFTGVLLQGLWGVAPSAFSPLLKTKVTSSSLGTYLVTEVPKVAAQYQLRLNPSVSPTFPDPDNVYFGDMTPPPQAPTFPAWPPPESVAGGAPAAAGPATVTTVVVTPRELTAQGLSKRDAGGLSVAKHILESVKESYMTMGQEPEAQGPGVGRPIDELPLPVGFGVQLKSQATSWITSESGFEVQGAQLTAVWLEAGLTVKPDLQSSARWIVQENGARLERPSAMLVELDNESQERFFLALAALPNFGAFLVCDKWGAAALRYGSMVNDPITALAVESALAAMESGALRGDQAETLARALRMGKHAAPVLGVIAAYLYDSAGDLESIRRFAQFYIEKGQPIPYDVAMLAQLEGYWRGSKLWVTVPQIAPRINPQPNHEWDSAAIRGGEGVVGGLWPWMRQGWAFLDAPEDAGSQLIRTALLDAREHLTRARFATMDHAGAMLLSNAFQLQRQESATQNQSTVQIHTQGATSQ
jgi:hypothetical protein